MNRVIDRLKGERDTGAGRDLDQIRETQAERMIAI